MITKLISYENQKPVFDQKNQKARQQTNALIVDILDNLDFFRTRLQEKQITYTDIHTHVGLLEHQFLDLAKICGYESVLQEEADQRTAKIREVMAENHRLEALLGQTATAASITPYIRQMLAVMDVWSHAYGIHYLRENKIYAYGLNLTITPKLDQTDADRKQTYRQPDLQQLFDVLAKDRHTLSQKDYHLDIEHMDYHDELKETDINKAYLRDLLYNDFPNMTVIKHAGRQNDNHTFSLELEFVVPFTDIEAFAEKYKN